MSHRHHRTTTTTTAPPTDWEHAAVLWRRHWDNDWRRHRRAWFLRLAAGPLLWMLYTLAFLFQAGSSSDNYVVVTGADEQPYRVFDGQPLPLPQSVVLGGARDDQWDLAQAVADDLNRMQQGDGGSWAKILVEEDADPAEDNLNNSTSFAERAGCHGDTSPDRQVCVWIYSSENDDVDENENITTAVALDLMFGGDESSSTDPVLAGTQQIVQQAVYRNLGVSSSSSATATATTATTVTQIQPVPAVDSQSKEDDSGNPFVLIFPGIMLVLASAVGLQFTMAPLSTDKFTDRVRSFVLVGVKLRVYLHAWLLYLSSQALITAALLTIVSFVWNMFPASSPGLVFLSHYLALVQLASVALLLTQLANQEELTQGLPWLMAIVSAAIGISLIVVMGPDEWLVLSLLTVVSPYVGMLQYCAIYSNYDAEGLEVGIHAGDNVAESGLLASFVGQAAGIVVWNLALLWWIRPRKRQHSASAPSAEKMETEHGEQEEGDIGSTRPEDKFEPLAPDAEVLLKVEGLSHTYEPACCQKSERVEVLKGLDLEICRGEVFGYLGHNSSGKTTSIGILSGELGLQEGTITYHFSEGNATVENTSDLSRIRQNIGVCLQHNDALHGDLSAREFLRLFANLKGRIPQDPGQTKAEAVEAEVERRLAEIKFTSSEDADKPIETYSGGMKRKVCIALAFLADPEVVFLDEPSAGIDPYNRRQVWDMIIAAKAGRSIILTTHFLDEADILSDRIAILKDGKVQTCGSSLFLKHQIAGYSLKYESENHIDISKYIDGAEPVEHGRGDGVHEWRLQHGSETSFASALRVLNDSEASNVNLELTSLEQVFLETGKETSDTDLDNSSGDHDGAKEGSADVTREQIKDVWKPQGSKTPLSEWGKVLLVCRFMITKARRIKGIIFLNIVQPLIYIVIGLVIFSGVELDEAEFIDPEPISVTTFLAGRSPMYFFGLFEIGDNAIAPMFPVTEPQDVADYFEVGLPFLGGFWDRNQTLQYNQTISPFVLQVGVQALNEYTAVTNGLSESLSVYLVQLPYVTSPFRVDLLLLPMLITMGFVGLVFSVLDVLLLKSDDIINLFRTSGISEWTTYQGIMLYKLVTSFLPFFAVVVILGSVLGSLLMGNGGRWLGTILVMLGYAYSTSPLGVIFAKRFITKDFKRAANVFPGVYMTFVSLPYIAWNMALQLAPEARQALLIVGDILCIFPPVAFQVGIGSIIAISTEANDPDLSWGEVFSWENRVWFATLIMVFIGTIEWYYLHRLAKRPPAQTNLGDDEHSASRPVDPTIKFGVAEERERSRVDDGGINARDLVKLFRINPPKDAPRGAKPLLKSAVKGVSFGIKRGEIFAALGPNGAGKSVTMGCLAGTHTPEYGEVALAGKKLTSDQYDHVFDSGIAFCPQFDALFPSSSVREHFHFYAKVRGLDINEESTIRHLEAIEHLLGLSDHMDKLSTDISGGYKRRTCLGIAMIGSPEVMMVDECTTGMDPGARHLVWSVLKPNGEDEVELPAILLSTHYMDEASQLGDRIAIFVDGEIVSVGSLSELQAEYCNSYFVEVALHPSATERNQENIVEVFASAGFPAEVYESLPYHFKLQVPFQSRDRLEQLACMFGLIEAHKAELNIKFYSIAQMSLEQIFIDLSRHQFEAEETTRFRESYRGSSRRFSQRQQVSQ